MGAVFLDWRWNSSIEVSNLGMVDAVKGNNREEMREGNRGGDCKEEGKHGGARQRGWWAHVRRRERELEGGGKGLGVGREKSGLYGSGLRE